MDLKAYAPGPRETRGLLLNPPDEITEMQETGWADLLRYDCARWRQLYAQD